MAVSVLAIDDEELDLFQKQVHEQDNLVISDVFAQSLINRIRDLKEALSSVTKSNCN